MDVELLSDALNLLASLKGRAVSLVLAADGELYVRLPERDWQVTKRCRAELTELLASGDKLHAEWPHTPELNAWYKRLAGSRQVLFSVLVRQALRQGANRPDAEAIAERRVDGYRPKVQGRAG